MLKRLLRRNKPPRAQRVAPHAEWLEQRLLYSADAGSLLGVDAALTLAPEERTLDASFEYDAGVAAAVAGVDVRTAFALAPLQFEADAGQLGAGVDFAASGLGYAVRLGDGNAELLLEGAEQPVTLTLVGGQPGAAEGQDLLATRSNYLVGADSSKWITDIVNYGSVLYRGVYDGIDVRYYGNQQRLEYDFIVAAGADASQLRLRFDGIEGASLDANGDLVLRVAGTGRDIRFQAPVSYQEGAGGREAVQSRYELQPDGTVRIVVGAYDTSRTLVVDPVLAHASYFGEGGNDTATGVAVGADGSVYVTGHTTSTAGSFGTRLAAGADASESYVARFNADLTSLVYATRVGGSGADQGVAITVDAWGNAIVVGQTRSTDFIVTAGADQATRNGNLQDAFVYKLNAAGNGLVFSTYFGGAGNNDVAEGVTLDAAGNIYVAGTVSATTDNAFLNKYTAAGASVYKLQYGGSGADGAKGIGVDGWGNVYIAGYTQSIDNVTLNGAQVTRPGGDDIFLAKYNSAGTLTYATYIGAAKADTATGLAVDSTGRAYVIGRTKDPATNAFATTAGAFATTAYSHEAGFLRIYNTTLTGAASLEYSTFIGGSRDAGGVVSNALTDSPTGVAVSGGQVVVVGHTDASDLPTTSDAYSRTNTSGDTGFAIVLAPQGGGSRDQIYGSYYGTGLTTGGVAWSGSRFYLVGTAGGAGGLATADGWKVTPGTPSEGLVAQFSGFTNVAPMLAGTNSVAAQLEDVPAAGTLVSDLLAGKFSDADAGALAGIAVTGFDAANGSWQFSVDGGTNWSTMSAPAAGTALVLNADALTRVRFAPAAHYNGSSSITFRAWDRSAGTAGTVAAMPTTGGSSAFSIGQTTASVTVGAVNDAPVRTAGTPGALTAGERTAAIPIAPALSGLAYAPATAAATDESGQALRYVVTGLPGETGTVLFNGVPVAVGGSYTLAELQSMTFLPGRAGSATFTFGVQDDGGTANGGQDTLGGQSVTFTVTNVAPVLTVSNVVLPAQLEDRPELGTRVADFLAGKVTDGGGAWGIAVVSVPNPGSNYGTWKYSLDDGATWLTLTGSGTSARLLGPDARVRFEPTDQSWNSTQGTVGGFGFRAWDGSTGIEGATANVNTNGGTTAFSTSAATVSLTITPVNDIPERVDVSLYSSTNDGRLPPPAPVTVGDSATTQYSLNLGYLRYVAGYSNDEYNKPLTFVVTHLPTTGTIILGDGTIAKERDTVAYTLAQIQGARFVPKVQGGTDDFVWELWDSDGTANGGQDHMEDRVTITVANTAPTLLNTSGTLAAIFEDAQTAPLVSTLVTNALTDASGAANVGVAITGFTTGSGGSWQWSSDAGSTWTDVTGVSTGNALLLNTGNQWRIRFLPAPDWNSNVGTSPTLTYRAWDRTTGTAGGRADTTVNGGTSAFSVGTRTVTQPVTAVNDAPVRTDIADRSLQTVSVLDGSPLTSLGLANLAFGRGGSTDEATQILPTSFRITALPDTVGRTYVTVNGVVQQATVGSTYTLDQIRTMQFQSLGLGIWGKSYLTFDVKDSGGTLNGGVDTLTFRLAVNVNQAPVLTGANSPLMVQEDFGGTGNIPSGNMPPWATSAQRAGISVADIVGNPDRIVDNTAALKGIAIIAQVGSGTWQYSIDGGTNWQNMPSVSNSAALLLAADANCKVRYIPGADWNSVIGETGLTFRAWDQTTGTTGQLGDASYHGGASSYSDATATSTVAVTARNDAPAAFNPVGGTVVEGEAAAPILVSGGYGPGPLTATDEASQLVTVTFPSGLPAGLELFLANGTAVNAATSYSLADFVGMTFRSPGTPGTFQLAFQLQDNGGVASGGVDRASFTLALTVTNKAPLLAGANAMGAILEDTPGAGKLVTDLVAWQVTDPTLARGIAVTTVDNSHGSWEYTRDGGTTWTAFGTLSDASARLLLSDSATRVRFVPAADWNGTATIAFAAWDGTAGSAGGVADTRVSGGATAFSAGRATSTLTVTAVNDAPVGGVTGSITVAEDSGSSSLGLGAVSYGPGGGGYESAQQLTYRVAALPPATLGRITLADGSDVTLRDYTIDEVRGMRFLAAQDGVGSGSFGFEVKDDGGGTDTLVQSVAITVTPLNDAPVAGFDLVAGTEDTILTLAPGVLLANDADVDGDTLAIVSVANGSGGTVDFSTGSVVFTPDADFDGQASFSYTISDGHGGTSITAVVVDLLPQNDAPRLAADSVSATEDQALAIAPATLLGNDSDVEGDAFTITGVSAAVGGTVSLSGGNIVFQPGANFNGTASFRYTVTDAQGATATGDVTVDVAPVNDPPVANPETLATQEDTPLTIGPATLLGNDTDIDGGTLSVLGVAAGNGGTVSISGSGDVVFTPDRDFNGLATFSYTVSDGKGGTASATVGVNVTAVNDPPAPADDYLTATTGVNLTIDPGELLANDRDAEGNTLAITGVGGAVNGIVSMVGGSILFVPLPLFSGPASFTYTVEDGNGGASTGTVHVNVQIGNAAPVARTDDLTTREDVPLTLDASVLLANDSDPNGDPLTITGVSALAGGTARIDGTTITFTPSADFNGAARFSYTVSDGRGGASTGTVNVTVTAENDAPTVAADAVAGTEDQALTIAPATLLANDRDVEGDAFSITGVTQGAGGSVALSGGNIVFTPLANFNGAGSFSYTVTDANGATSTATVTVDVAPVNDAPVAKTDALATAEDTPLTIVVADLLANDTDVEGDVLSFAGATSGAGGTVAPSGSNLVFTPNANFDGTGSFSYTVADGHGGTSTVTVTVNVTPVNDPPVARPETLGGSEDQVQTIAPATLLANDTDVDGDTLSITGVGGATGGTVELSGGNIVFRPTANFNGAASFTYTVSDPDGRTATATVTLDLAAVNDAPVGTADAGVTAEDVPLTLSTASLLANDTDLDLDTLAVAAVGNASGGTVSLANGEVVFRPTADFHGTGSFTYTLDDGRGGTATATVTVTVTSANDNPVAVADAASTAEDTPLTIAPASLVANDTDVDGDALTFVDVFNGANGTVRIVGGAIVFTPDADFSGTASFGYTVSDGQGGSATGTVTVDVTPVNDAPRLVDDTLSGTEDALVVVTPDTLLANDGDVERDALVIVSVAADSGSRGTVAISGDSIIFTPDADFFGVGSFSYTVRDAQGASSTATVYVDVAAVNDAPVAHADVVDATEDQALVIVPGTLLANDTDTEGDALTVVGAFNATGGTVAMSGANVVFTPDRDFEGIGKFDYTMVDSRGATATATVTVNVAPVNDAPVVQDELLGTLEDTPLVLLPADLLANDSDVEGDALVVLSVASGTGGFVEYSGGQVIFTPDPEFSGNATFSYVVSDGQGGATTATVTVKVDAVNDAPVAGGDSVDAVEDTPVAVAATTLLANDSDVERDPLAVTGVGSAVGGRVEFDGTTITYTPDADFSGTGSFSYTVSDGNGGTTTGTVTVNVAGVQDAPVAVDDTVLGVENTTLTITADTLLGNDRDVDRDPLVITSVTRGAGGTVVLSGTDIVFTPDGDFNGDGSFTYTMEDGRGGTATATVTVKVQPVNDAPVAADDTVLATEDTALVIDPATLLGNDGDVDGDALTITQVTSGANGSVEIVAGKIVFTPAADFNGDTTFGYTVSDGFGGTAAGVVTVRVAPANDAPVARPGTAVVAEAGTVAGQAQASDVDAGDSLSYALVANPLHGSVVFNADGSFSYRHDGSENFSDGFTFEVRDAAGGTSRSTVSVTVTPVNDAPVAQAGSEAVAEGGTVNGQLAATDAENDALSYTLVTPAANGAVTVNADGTFSYRHDGSENFSDVFTFEVRDASGATSQSTVGITITPLNDTPLAQAGSASVSEGGTATGQLTATDAENDALSYTLVTPAANGAVTVDADGSFSYTHDGSENFGDVFTFEVRDASGATSRSTVSLTINPVNDAPVAQAGNGLVTEGGSVNGQLSATDAENDAMTYSLVAPAAYGAVSVNADGSFSYAHNGTENFSDVFTFEVRDASGATSRSTVSITITQVNDAPVAQAGSASVSEGGTASGQLTATDAENDALSYTLVTPAANGAVAVNADGSFSYAHNGSENFNDVFTFEVRDASGATSRSTVSITVTPVNDAPVAQAGSTSVSEGDTATGQLTATDAENGALTYTLVTPAANGAVTVNADGTFSYRHNGTENFNDVFTFEVRDASGATSQSTVGITITPVNDTPSAQAGSASVSEGGTATGQLTATDAENDALSYILVTPAAHGAVTVNADGSFSYAHNGSENFNDVFTFEVRDSFGATSRSTVSITVTPVNDAPVAQAGSEAVAEGGRATGQLTATDAENDALSYSLATPAAYGAVTVNADGTFSYAHNGSENFSDVFTFEVRDASGATSRSTVSITITPINDAPVAQPGSQAVAEAGTVNGQLTATDAENDALVYTLITPAANGAVTVNADGSFSYRHNGSENFNDVFTFEVRDAAGAASRSTVSITITPVNDTPAAQPGSEAVAEGGTVNGQLAGTDAENDALTYRLVTPAAYGAVTVNADGTFSYRHDGTENFSDVFTFEVRDASGATSRSTVSLTVTPVNDAPVAQAGSEAVAEGGTVNGQLAATDAENNALTYSLVTPANYGAVIVNADGSFRYTHNGSENFSDVFTFEARDASGATSRSTVSITINPVNDAPVAQAGSGAVVEGGTVNGQLTATDAENGALSYTLLTPAANGAVTVNADGSFSYTHNGSENLNDVFTFEVRDASGATSRAAVSLTVTPVNDAPVAQASSEAVAEGGTVNGRLAGTDAENDALGYTLVTPAAHGAVTVNADGTFSYRHDGTENFSDVFTFEVRDASGTTSRSTVSITITAVNDAPVAQAGSTTVSEGGTATGQLTATDAENDALSYTLVTPAANGAVTLNADGTFSYAHNGTENFSDVFTFEARDASGATSRSTVSVTITPVNDAPVAQAGSATVSEGGTATGQLAATDAENDVLSYTLVTPAANGAVTVNADGSFSYAHDGSETSSDVFTFEARDASGATSRSTASLTVTPVNDAPVAQAGSETVAEGASVNGQLTATDADGDALGYTLLTPAANGAVTVNADGTFSYRHDGTENFTDAFTFEVTDAAGATSQSTVRLRITPVNDAPTAQTGSATATEGGTATGQLVATDAENGVLSYSLVTPAAHGAVTVNADGTFSYRHDGTENFGDTFTFEVTDASGASSRSTVGIAIAPVNDAPVAQAGAAAVAEGGAVTGRVTAADADAGDSLRYTLVAGAAHGTVTVNADGSFTYAHDGGESVTDAFTWRVTDASGASSDASVRISVTPVDDASVLADDSASVAEDATLTGNVLSNDSDADSTLAIASFSVAGDPTGYAAGASATIAGVGSLRIAADGSYSFTPVADWNGSVPAVSYRTDTGATGLLAITVLAVDDATVTGPDVALGTEDTPVSGNVLANDRDVDSGLSVTGFRIAGKDYAAGTSVTVAGVGTLTLNADGSWIYAPVAEWAGTVPQVSYTTGTGATGVLAISVTPVNDAPVRTGTLAELGVTEGASAPLGFAGVSYGVGGGSDEAQSQTLTVRVTGVPAELGTIVLADGTRVAAGATYTVAQLQGMVFRAAAGVSGSSTFSFTVSDGAGGTDSLAQQLTVRVANAAPVLDGANVLPSLREDATGNDGMRVADLVAGHAIDAGAQPGVAVVGAASSAGQWQYSRDGGAHWSTFDGVSAASAELLRADDQARIRFLPNADWNGTATGLTFRAWDGSGGTAAATRADATVNGGSSPFSASVASTSVAVDAVNDAPRALGADVGVIGVDAAAGVRTLDELAWAYGSGGGDDEAGQALTVTVTALPASGLGQLVLADGTTPVALGASYTPDQLRGLRFIAATGTGGGTAEVAWVVRDDGGTDRGGVDETAGSVKIAVVAPAQALPTPPSAPVPTPAASPAPDTAVPATQPAPVATTPAAVRPGGEAGATDPLAPTAPPAFLMPPGGEFAFAPPRTTDFAENSRILGAPPRLHSEVTLVGFNPQGVGDFEITGLAALDLGQLRVTTEQFQQSLRSGIFIEELNRLRNELREEFDLDKTLSVSVAGLSLGVSVAYVLWLVRGGVLVGSYLSALPAWRLLDPLPVLAREDDEAHDDDDEDFDPDENGRSDPLRGFS